MDFGLYIHVPFCRTVCPYCEFNVVGWREQPWDEYLGALLRELRAQYAAFQGHSLRTLYFGGGTPSLMPIHIVERVIEEVRVLCGSEGLSEISFELNPGTVDRNYLAELRRMGVERVSIGWQATQERLLKVLGRDHNNDESRLITQWALELGFRAVNLDVIFAVPGQSLRELSATVDEVVASKTHHISMYEMTFHEGTPFARKRDKGQLTELDESLSVEMMELISTRLDEAGFDRYEISNFARPGHRSLHNEAYWHGLPYLGVGPGAHGLRSYADDIWERYQSVVSIKEWLAHWSARDAELRVEWQEQLSKDTRFEERALTVVRLGDAFDETPSFVPEARVDAWRRGLERALEQGWLEYIADGRVRTTAQGMRFADSLGLLLVET